MSTKKLRLAFTGGGTGGHILPILSLLQTIDTSRQYRQQIDKVFWFGEKESMEANFFDQHQDTFEYIQPQFISIIAGKYRRETIRRSRLKNIRDIFLFPIGIIQSIIAIVYHKIDVVFCKWGYVSLPVVIAARLCRKKIVVHDSDTHPGLTTRFASRFAHQNFSWFPDTLPDGEVIGQILSDKLVVDLLPLPFVLPSDKHIILIAGGSSGSKKLYEGVLQAIAREKNLQDKYFFIFVNGNHIIDPEYIQGLEQCILITDLITDQAVMGWLYRVADKAIVRGGTTTLAECKLFDLPLVIVPLPITHDQAGNAEFYVQQYSDVMISQNDPDFIPLLIKHISTTIPKSFELTSEHILERIRSAKYRILDSLFDSKK